jgi:RNA polymerase sigma-70 factor, ECF subfamily
MDAAGLPQRGSGPAGEVKPRTADSSVVEQLLRGEPGALAQAYDEHHEQLRLYARRLVGDDDEAEDLVQETFLSLPRAMSGFRGAASLQSFLVGIATNHARHHVRAAARRRAAHLRSEEASARAAPPTPEERTHRRELAEGLIHALDELPFEQRVAVVLCEVEERTSAEAAAIVGAPEATVRTRVFHARKKLRAALEARGLR